MDSDDEALDAFIELDANGPAALSEDSDDAALCGMRADVREASDISLDRSDNLINARSVRGKAFVPRRSTNKHVGCTTFE